MTGDARVAEQQLFVSDVLYELSKEFTYKSYAAPDLRDKKLPASSAYFHPIDRIILKQR
jgi:hypothetical protein